MHISNLKFSSIGIGKVHYEYPISSSDKKFLKETQPIVDAVKNQDDIDSVVINKVEAWWPDKIVNKLCNIGNSISSNMQKLLGMEGVSGEKSPSVIYPVEIHLKDGTVKKFGNENIAFPRKGLASNVLEALKELQEQKSTNKPDTQPVSLKTNSTKEAPLSRTHMYQ